MPGPEHLRRLAREPRPTGGPQAAEARQYCGEVLTSLGYRVVELPFEYSRIVGEMGVAGVKAALDRVGLAGGPVRAPLAPLSVGELAQVTELLRVAELSLAA
ncbi:MAG: hypothetical protein DMD26_08890 [Gemmatimonadetes bacterium]|nr:MAG: hypothetical protein DMD26_08890 [Gemmatimonadota bacterium]